MTRESLIALLLESCSLFIGGHSLEQRTTSDEDFFKDPTCDEVVRIYEKLALKTLIREPVTDFLLNVTESVPGTDHGFGARLDRSGAERYREWGLTQFGFISCLCLYYIEALFHLYHREIITP